MRRNHYTHGRNYTATIKLAAIKMKRNYGFANPWHADQWCQHPRHYDHPTTFPERSQRGKCDRRTSKSGSNTPAAPIPANERMRKVAANAECENASNKSYFTGDIIRLGLSYAEREQPESSPIQNVGTEESTTPEIRAEPSLTENVASVTLGDIIRLGLFPVADSHITSQCTGGESDVSLTPNEPFDDATGRMDDDGFYCWGSDVYGYATRS